MTLTPVITTYPTVFAPDQRQRRSRLIQEAGAALRDDPTVTRLRGTMTATIPRAVRMDFTFADDRTPYRLTFPNTVATVTLWMPGRFARWETLATWALADFAAGADLWAAVKAILDAPEMDVLHRWLEEAPNPQKRNVGGVL